MPTAATLGSPWGTFDFAIDNINPGDTLFVRGGTYNLNSTNPDPQ